MNEEENELRKEEVETQTQLLATLEKLGGKIVRDDDITYEGTRFVIPERMSSREAVQFLRRHVEQQEEETMFSKVFLFRPWDGANAFQNAVKRVTGTAGIGRATYSFFGKNPPEMRTINVGPHETIQIPWGAVEIPLFKGQAYLGSVHSKEHGLVFQIGIEAPRKFKHAIEGLFKVIQEELENDSIYRGRAIDADDDPNFKDTSVVDPDQIVFSEQALADLGAQLWWPIEDVDGVRKQGLRVKRAILLEGSYGTGKTETANITAKKCEENGWTFIQVRSSQDDFAGAMRTARLYQPAVVFFEDVDVIADSEKNSSSTMSHLLDLFDGMDAKNTEIIAVLTTNHVDKIHKGMLRPGRLDGIVHLGSLDRPGVEKLAYIQLGYERVRDVDFDAVYQAMDGYMPAFVNRAFAKAVEYSRGADEYTTDDLVRAAEGLRPQFQLYVEASEESADVGFDDILIPALKDVLGDSWFSDEDGDTHPLLGKFTLNIPEEGANTK